MNQCIDCGTELPSGAHFCGNCGKVQNKISSDQFTQLSEPRLQAIFPPGADPMATLVQEKNRPSASASSPSFSGKSVINTPGQIVPEGNQEQRKAALLDAAALAPGSPPQAPHMPVIQGTPQVNHLPVIQGSPQGANQLPPSHFPSGNAAHMAAPQPPASGVSSPIPGHPGAPQFPGSTPPNISPPGASGQIAAPSGNPPQFGPQQPPSYTGGSPYNPYEPHHYAGQTGPTSTIDPSRYPTGHGVHAGQTVAAKAAGGVATKLIIIVIAAIVAVGGGAGALAYIVTRPQPVISVSSQYTVDKVPTGSTGTRLHFTGHQFAGSSAITFLLDNAPAPGAPQAISDQNGNASADLTITAGWSPGLHTLTARDAGNNTSKTGVKIRIVPQGQAHTPGPSGAPPDDASFRISAQESGQYVGSGSFTRNELLIVTGHPDPAGGSVCKSSDTGQSQHLSGLKTGDTGIPYSEDITLTCSGTYKSGSLTYTETLVANVITLDTDGGIITCRLKEPKVFELWSGSYNLTGNFTGTITYPGIPQENFSCTKGNYDYFNFYYFNGTATWTGIYTLS